MAVVPKSVVAFLLKELSPMEKEGAKEIDLPFGDNAMMQINKKDNDVYSGAIVE